LTTIGFKSFLFSFLFILFGFKVFGQEGRNFSNAEILIQKQLDAFNQRDVDAFMNTFAEKVKVYEFPNTLLYDSIEEMGSQYGRMFARTPDLNSKLLNRITLGETVIDHQKITINPNEDPIEVIIIYIIKNKKISEVFFKYENN